MVGIECVKIIYSWKINHFYVEKESMRANGNPKISWKYHIEIWWARYRI